MKIQALNMAETQAHLLTHFPYYDAYLNWRFNDDDERKTDFTLISYQDLIEPINRSISDRERKQIICSMLKRNQKLNIDLPKKLFLLNSYDHSIGINWPGIFQKAHNNRHILKTKRLFTMCGVPQQSFYDAYGFICTDVQPYVLFRHIFFYRFLCDGKILIFLIIRKKQLFRLIII